MRAATAAREPARVSTTICEMKDVHKYTIVFYIQHVSETTAPKKGASYSSAFKGATHVLLSAISSTDKFMRHTKHKRINNKVAMTITVRPSQAERLDRLLLRANQFRVHPDILPPGLSPTFRLLIGNEATAMQFLVTGMPEELCEPDQRENLLNTLAELPCFLAIGKEVNVIYPDPIDPTVYESGVPDLILTATPASDLRENRTAYLNVDFNGSATTPVDVSSYTAAVNTAFIQASLTGFNTDKTHQDANPPRPATLRGSLSPIGKNGEVQQPSYAAMAGTRPYRTAARNAEVHPQPAEPSTHSLQQLDNTSDGQHAQPYMPDHPRVGDADRGRARGRQGDQGLRPVHHAQPRSRSVADRDEQPRQLYSRRGRAAESDDAGGRQGDNGLCPVGPPHPRSRSASAHVNGRKGNSKPAPPAQRDLRAKGQQGQHKQTTHAREAGGGAERGPAGGEQGDRQSALPTAQRDPRGKNPQGQHQQTTHAREAGGGADRGPAGGEQGGHQSALCAAQSNPNAPNQQGQHQQTAPARVARGGADRNPAGGEQGDRQTLFLNARHPTLAFTDDAIATLRRYLDPATIQANQEKTWQFNVKLAELRNQHRLRAAFESRNCRSQPVVRGTLDCYVEAALRLVAKIPDTVFSAHLAYKVSDQTPGLTTNWFALALLMMQGRLPPWPIPHEGKAMQLPYQDEAGVHIGTFDTNRGQMLLDVLEGNLAVAEDTMSMLREHSGTQDDVATVIQLAAATGLIPTGSLAVEEARVMHCTACGEHNINAGCTIGAHPRDRPFFAVDLPGRDMDPSIGLEEILSRQEQADEITRHCHCCGHQTLHKSGTTPRPKGSAVILQLRREIAPGDPSKGTGNMLRREVTTPLTLKIDGAMYTLSAVVHHTGALVVRASDHHSTSKQIPRMGHYFTCVREDEHGLRAYDGTQKPVRFDPTQPSRSGLLYMYVRIGSRPVPPVPAMNAPDSAMSVDSASLAGTLATSTHTAASTCDEPTFRIPDSVDPPASAITGRWIDFEGATATPPPSTNPATSLVPYSIDPTPPSAIFTPRNPMPEPLVPYSVDSHSSGPVHELVFPPSTGGTTLASTPELVLPPSTGGTTLGQTPGEPASPLPQEAEWQIVTRRPGSRAQRPVHPPRTRSSASPSPPRTRSKGPPPTSPATLTRAKGGKWI